MGYTGVILVDKPRGPTSHQVAAWVGKMLKSDVGHSGTLDPMATGLLPLCFGEATKFSADLLDADKTYEADVKLGITTDTGDAEGQVLTNAAVTTSIADVERLLPRFTGPIKQVPPMHSALKRDGRPLYELARQGVEVEREAVGRVHVRSENQFRHRSGPFLVQMAARQ